MPLDQPTGDSARLTELINRADESPDSFAALVEAAYDVVHARAANLIRRVLGHDGSASIQATALADDVLMRMRDQRKRGQDTGEFLAIASYLMQNMMTDVLRKRNRIKRGRDWQRIDAEVDSAPDDATNEEDSRLERTLDRLAALTEADPRKAEVFVLRAQLQLPMETVAEVVGISLSTAERDWRAARSFLLE